MQRSQSLVQRPVVNCFLTVVARSWGVKPGHEVKSGHAASSSRQSLLNGCNVLTPRLNKGGDNYQQRLEQILWNKFLFNQMNFNQAPQIC